MKTSYLKLNKSIFFKVISIFIIIVLFSCNKDNIFEYKDQNILSKRDQGIEIFPFNYPDVNVVNGMIYLPSPEIYDSVLNTLERLNQDSIFINDFLNELGFDTSDYLNYNYPWDPAFEKFNKILNFESLGKSEQNRMKDFLLKGNNPEDFQDHFIQSNNKFLLNKDNEIKIGERIYKFINEKDFFIVFNNDFLALDYLRNLADKSTFTNRKNVLKFNKNFLEDINRNNSILRKPVVPINPRSTTGDCDVELNVETIDDNTVRIFADIPEGTLLNCTWIIKNKNNEIVFESNNNGFIEFDRPNPDYYPYKVSVIAKIENELKQICYANKFVNFSFPKQSDPCNKLDLQFAEAYRGKEPGKWYFGISMVNNTYPNPVNYKLIWDFGDGTVVEGNYYQNNHCSHYYNENEYEETNRKICVTVIDEVNNCSNTICKTITTGCGYEVTNRQEYWDYTPKDRIIGQLILDYGHGGDFGSGIDEFTAKFANFHLYHSVLGFDYWWQNNKLLYPYVYFSLTAYDKCVRHQSDTGLLDHKYSYKETFKFIHTKNRWTQKKQESWASFNFGEGPTRFGPFTIYWRP